MHRKIIIPPTAALICIALCANANEHAFRPVSTLGTKFLNKASEAHNKLDLTKDNHNKEGRFVHVRFWT